MPGALTPSFLRRGLALAMLLLSQQALAVGLGEIEVRSALGQVLDARIPLALEPGKPVDASCFSLMRGARDRAVPTLVRGALTLERASGVAVLRIRSPVTISEPALALRVRAACPGRPDQDERQYTVLLDPAPGTQGVSSIPVIGASLAARRGDTLASIAGQVFPEDRAARLQYLAALREANPDLERAGDGPLPEGASVELPDLRTYARLVTPTATPTPVPKAIAAQQPPPVSRHAATGAFVLKLSGPDVDLARSRGMDERKRAQLRQRLALLDEDDHVATLLSLRNNVRQLESRVAELQLKLASMPSALAKPGAPAASPAPSAKAAPASQAEAAPRRAPPDDAPWWKEYLANPWAWGLLVIALLAAVLMRRPRRVAWDRDPTPSALLPSPPPAEMPPVAGSEDSLRPRPAASPGAGPAKVLPEDSRELRRRYIEERFPEIANRTLVLENPSSVIKGARLFHEDGATPRAVELLKFSIEDDPGEVRPWLALFEIFRLDGNAVEYAALARRFQGHHGGSEHWRKVRYFGREIDPANPLYREDSPTTASFDPIEENWLDAPMDFENAALANELRRSLLERASVSERDLEPNPMPALRDVEIFRVA